MESGKEYINGGVEFERKGPGRKFGERQEASGG